MPAWSFSRLRHLYRTAALVVVDGIAAECWVFFLVRFQSALRVRINSQIRRQRRLLVNLPRQRAAYYCPMSNWGAVSSTRDRSGVFDYAELS